MHAFHLLAISAGVGFDPPRWRRILGSGIDGIMLREKQMEAGELLDLARWIQDLAPHLELWVNGRLDVALAAGCGLHAPEAYPEPLPEFLPLSRPLHGEVQWEARRGTRQLLIAPVLASPGKGEPWGQARLHRFLDGLPEAASGAPRMLALGGLEPLHVPLVHHPRLDGIAAIRALWEAPDPAEVVASFRQRWEAGSTVWQAPRLPVVP